MNAAQLDRIIAVGAPMLIKWAEEPRPGLLPLSKLTPPSALTASAPHSAAHALLGGAASALGPRPADAYHDTTAPLPAIDYGPRPPPGDYWSPPRFGSDALKMPLRPAAVAGVSGLVNPPAPARSAIPPSFVVPPGGGKETFNLKPPTGLPAGR